MPRGSPGRSGSDTHELGRGVWLCWPRPGLVNSWEKGSDEFGLKIQVPRRLWIDCAVLSGGETRSCMLRVICMDGALLLFIRVGATM